MQGVLGAFCALNAAHGSRARREGSGMCSRCPWAAPILVPRPGVPGERPGPAEPLPHTWRAELSPAAAAAAQSRLGSGVRVPFLWALRSCSLGFAFLPSRVCVPAPFTAAPSGPGAAGAPPLPRSDTRWRRPEMRRPRRGPGSSLVPGLRPCPAASRALGKPCRAAPPCCAQQSGLTGHRCQNASHGGIHVSRERELLMGQ